MLHRFTHTVLATVPEDNEESAGGHGNCMHEHPIGDATAFTGFYRDHRGKLQSVYELCEDVADYEEEGGEDEADQVFRAAAGTVPTRPQAQGQLLGNVFRKRLGLPTASCVVASRCAAAPLAGRVSTGRWNARSSTE